MIGMIQGKHQKLINDFNRRYCNVLRYGNRDSVKLWSFGGEVGKRTHLVHEWKKLNICYGDIIISIAYTLTRFNAKTIVTEISKAVSVKKSNQDLQDKRMTILTNHEFIREIPESYKSRF